MIEEHRDAKEKLRLYCRDRGLPYLRFLLKAERESADKGHTLPLAIDRTIAREEAVRRRQALIVKQNIARLRRERKRSD